MKAFSPNSTNWSPIGAPSMGSSFTKTLSPCVREPLIVWRYVYGSESLSGPFWKDTRPSLKPTFPSQVRWPPKILSLSDSVPAGPPRRRHVPGRPS